MYILFLKNPLHQDFIKSKGGLSFERYLIYKLWHD